MLSTAFSASWGQGGGGNYGDDDDDDGLSGGEIAAITIGGLGAAYGIWLLAGADDDDDDDAETQATFVPGSAGKASAVRLVAPKGGVAAGENAVLRLEARRGNKWVNVTDERGSSFNVSGSSVTRMDGAKNAFAVPMTAAAGNAVAEGRYVQPDGTVLTAKTTVNVGG
jgi:hypothetical protein